MATKAKPKNRISDVERNGNGKHLVISPPNLKRARFQIYGTSPYVQDKFSGRRLNDMINAQQASKATTRGAKKPRDIEADYNDAFYKTAEIWNARGRVPVGAYIRLPGCRVSDDQG